MTAYALTPVIVTIKNGDGVLEVFVDWRRGSGAEFRASFPTGDQAAYPEARDRARAAAERNANALRNEILARYPQGVYAPVWG